MALNLRYKNKYFEALMGFINTIQNDKTYSEINFEQKIHEILNEPINDIALAYIREFKMEYDLFNNLSKDGKKSMQMEPLFAWNHLPSLPMTEEYKWLYSIMHHPYISLFLDCDEITHILSLLPENAKVLTNWTLIVKDQQDEYVKYSQNQVLQFRLFLEALSRKCYIGLSSKTVDGKSHLNVKFIPLKIEYSTQKKHISLSLFHVVEERPVLVKLKNVISLQILEPIDLDLIKNELDVLSNRLSENEVVLYVDAIDYVLDRVNLLFAQYGKTSKIISSNIMEIRFNYFVFDENEIINEIMSLGPFVEVISPPIIRNAIITRISHSF